MTFPETPNNQGAHEGVLQIYPSEAATISLPPPGFVVHSRSLLEYCEIVWRHKTMLSAIILLFTGCVFGAVKLQRPVYRGITSVLFQKSSELITVGRTQASVDNGGAEAEFGTQVELFQSKALLARVLSTFKNGQPQRDRELQFVTENLKVTPAKGTRLIRIQADSHDPVLAAAFANAIVKESIAREHEGESARSEADRNWLNQQVANLRRTIEASEQHLFSYANANGLAYVNEKEKASDNRLVRLQDELSKAQVDRFAAEARYESALTTSPEAASNPSESGTLREYQSRLTELRRQLADATSLWTTNHYKVKQLEAQIAVVNAAIDKERQDVTSRAKSEYASAVRREQLLTTAYLGGVKVVTDQANRSIHYNLLKRDLDRDREIYDEVLQKVKQVSITSGLQPSTIHLIDAAEPPIKPDRPNVALASCLAFVCSTFLGVMAVLIKDTVGEKIQQPGDSALYLNVNELGNIPSERIFTQWLRSKRLLTSRAAPLLDISHRTKTRGALEGGVEFATWNETESLTAQCFRATLASILFFSHQKNGYQKVRNLVVTSAGSNEGKTMVVSNLGLALARMRRRVLLVDADYRRPRLHKLFDLTNSRGLREILGGHGTVALSDVVQETRIPGLFLLQSGAIDPSFPEILQSARMAELVQAANAEFDFVLIDTPPVLHLPDARIWGRLSDGVVLVVRAGRTNRARAWAAVYRLAKDGVPFLGTVLNDWDPKGSLSYDYRSSWGRTA